MRLVSLGLVLSLVASLACGAEFDPAKLPTIGQRMQRFVDEPQVAGAMLVVGTSKGVAWQQGIGVADIETKTQIDDATMFRIASMTKPITALGIMILAVEKKLAIDDPVERHLPEFKGQMLVAERTPEKVTLTRPSRPITIKDLCTHTSGIPPFPPGLADIYFARQRTVAEMTLAMSQKPLDFEPGTKWAYCNPGIDALGRIIEVVSGKPYEQFMAERIFQPLGMTESTFYLNDKQKTRFATLYDVKDGKLQKAGNGSGWVLIGPTENAKHPIPAGGLLSCGRDLAILYQCLLNKGELNGERIVSAESLQAMTQNQIGDVKGGFTPGLGMGLGFQVVREPQGVTATLKPGAYGHGGAFGTQGWLDPTQDFFAILLIQRTGMPNGDASAIRTEFQQAIADAMKK
jgi:CubicO group peptidase (beta-lactamase class C family)